MKKEILQHYHRDIKDWKKLLQATNANKLENQDEMNTFLEKYIVSKLNEEEAGSLNRPITEETIEAVIKNLLAHKSLRPDGFIR